jgi:hypothetical protein
MIFLVYVSNNGDPESYVLGCIGSAYDCLVFIRKQIYEFYEILDEKNNEINYNLFLNQRPEKVSYNVYFFGLIEHGLISVVHECHNILIHAVKSKLYGREQMFMAYEGTHFMPVELW